MYRFLGEFDCEADLADAIGSETAAAVWEGKSNYFHHLETGFIFGVPDFMADAIFDSGNVL